MDRDFNLLKSCSCCLRLHSLEKGDFFFFFFFSFPAAAAAAASLQSCPTLCDPIDSGPPGSPVPGILQARTLEWVAISFSKAWKWKVNVKSLSRVWLFETPWTAAHQAPPPTGFSRQEYWSGVPLPSPFISWETTINKSCSHGDLIAHSHVYTRDGKSGAVIKGANEECKTKGWPYCVVTWDISAKPQPSPHTCYSKCDWTKGKRTSAP